MRYAISFIGTLLALASLASADLDQASLKPVGGDTYKVGDGVNVEWVATKAMTGKYDIYISIDGGKTYPTSMEVGNWQGPTIDGSKATYRWVFKAAHVSTEARFKVCQLAGGHCTQPGVYTISTPANFIVSSSSGIQSGPVGAAPSLRFVPESRSLEVSFGLGDARQVEVQAFDTRGKLLVSLDKGRMEAGDHRFSVFSNRLDASAPILFKLKVGDQVTTQSWNGLN